MACIRPSRIRIVKFLFSRIGIAMFAAIVAIASLSLPQSAGAMNSASYRMQAENANWSPPLAGTSFRIIFNEPDDPQPEQEPQGGIALPYRPPGPPPAPIAAPPPTSGTAAPLPGTAAPSPGTAAPAPGAPPPNVLPVGRPTAVTPIAQPVVMPTVRSAPAVQSKAPAKVNGVPQRSAAPARGPVAPAKLAPTSAPKPAALRTLRIPTLRSAVPRRQLQKSTFNPVTAPGAILNKGPLSQPSLSPRVQIPTTISPQPKTSGVPAPARRAQRPGSPQTKTSAPPLSQQVQERLESRLRTGIAFASSLFEDAHGDPDPVRSGLIVACAFLVVLLTRARRRLRAVAPRARRRVGSGPFVSRRIHPVRTRRAFLLVLLPLLMAVSVLLGTPSASAAGSVPPYYPYTGYLLNSSGNPVSGEFRIRFSYWNTANAFPSDRQSNGLINTAAPGFLGWQEVDVVAPGNKGAFTVMLGNVTPLPDFSLWRVSDLRTLHLQVEVKSAAADDTAYELLDPSPDETIDRSPVLPNVYSRNADFIDGRDVGTGSGSLPLLGTGGVLGRGQMGGATNANVFTIDADGSAYDSVGLKFGETLGKTLSFNYPNMRFEFNAPVRIQGDLTVTGLVNGVNIATLGSSPLRVWSGTGLTVNVASGSYRINGAITHFSGSGFTLTNNTEQYLFFTGTGFVARTGGYPNNISFIPIATVTTQNGGVVSVSDQRVLQSDSREHSMLEVLHPGYPDAAYDADGSQNVGQLSVDHDTFSKRNFYQWTSSKPALNDYDLVVRYTLPQKFIRWQPDPLKLHYKTSSGNAADTKADIEVYDTAGNAVTLGGSSSNLTSTSWTSTGLTFSGSPTWTAGQTFTIKVRMFAKDSGTVQIGDLEIKTVELDRQ